MFVVKDGALVLVNPQSVVQLGKVKDARVEDLEKRVADKYNISVHELNNWYRDTEAKNMVCFLLHHLFNYSISSLAKGYNINYGYLKHQINNIYVKCLQDDSYMRFVTAIKQSKNQVLQN